MPEFTSRFAGLDDPRARNARRHSLHDILVIAIGAMLCGGQTCTDMELFGYAKRELIQFYLKLEHGIPIHDTLSSPASWGCWPRRPPSSVLWASCNSLPRVARSSSRWTGKPYAVLTAGPSSAPPCIWSAPGPRRAAVAGAIGRGHQVQRDYGAAQSCWKC